ncbi:TPA: plasmid replication initiator-like protein [Citrobacter farmeri]|nr:plasmid replication initiator-like protein [Citrobacter farmeri]HCB1668133.1 plasmid replication initiator-like protein [Citrobacter farmeri]HCB1673533.1 plasmid replication initiator-like protein [Citrobacter farmeri]HCB1778229.1 plasmid replication initiator-like protein [Citrobacter farmeri]HCB1783638.1 plasmid replication initiator-like protein [Citrobacter farmeri]
MTDDESRMETLEQQLSQARALLTHTVDTLQEERRLAAVAKNRVPGGYYMMSRAAEKNLRAIQRDNPTAALMFSVIREHMQIGTNALTISQAALCKILGSSRTTIYRASKYLAENNYVQLIKTGNVTTYVVNEQVAFAGSAGQRKAVFSTTLVAHECEQDEGWAEVRKLKSVPIIYGDERIVLGCDELPPPDQQDLDL